MKELKDWNKQALKMREEGYKSRAIAERLLGRSTAKSTVTDFFLKYDNGLYSLIEKERKSLNGVPLHEYVFAKDLETPKKEPRILTWDLESSLLEGYFFRIWQENIPMRRIKKQAHLLSASFAFNNEEVQGFRLTPEQVKTGDDFEIVRKVVEAVNSCDLMVTFNGKRFDVKLLNTRALFWGLPPVKQPKHIDLFEQSKRVFKFPSNSMQNVSLYLGEHGKLETSGSHLWERCAEWWNHEECDKALQDMLIYGNQDINATRDLYNRFQGWMKGVPNLGTITNEVSGNNTLRCIHCGSDDIFHMNDVTYTSVSSFYLYRCAVETCRGISRITKNGKNLVGVV